MNFPTIESAPKDYSCFLGYSNHWGWIEVAWGKTADGEGFCAVPFGWQIITDLTHWTTLPEKPR